MQIQDQLKKSMDHNLFDVQQNIKVSNVRCIVLEELHLEDVKLLDG